MSRYRIGLMVPSSNTVMEPDFQQAFDGIATVHAARMYLPDPYTPDDELRMIDEFAADAARDIGTLHPDVVVFGCTSAGALRGPTYDAELRGELAEKTACPMVGVFDTISEALSAREKGRIAVSTPYTEELNEAIARSLTADGFDVVSMVGMGLRRNVEVGRVVPEDIIDFVVANTPDDAEAVAVPCTNFRAFEVHEQITARLGRPVVTANSSVIEAVRARLGAVE